MLLGCQEFHDLRTVFSVHSSKDIIFGDNWETHAFDILSPSNSVLQAITLPLMQLLCQGSHHHFAELADLKIRNMRRSKQRRKEIVALKVSEDRYLLDELFHRDIDIRPSIFVHSRHALRWRLDLIPASRTELYKMMGHWALLWQQIPAAVFSQGLGRQRNDPVICQVAFPACSQLSCCLKTIPLPLHNLFRACFGSTQAGVGNQYATITSALKR